MNGIRNARTTTPARRQVKNRPLRQEEELLLLLLLPLPLPVLPLLLLVAATLLLVGRIRFKKLANDDDDDDNEKLLLWRMTICCCPLFGVCRTDKRHCTPTRLLLPCAVI